MPQLKQQLADTKGIFKGKERKALEAKIKDTETEIADRLDKIPDTLKEDGYPDVQCIRRWRVAAGAAFSGRSAA